MTKKQRQAAAHALDLLVSASLLRWNDSAAVQERNLRAKEIITRFRRDLCGGFDPCVFHPLVIANAVRAGLVQ